MGEERVYSITGLPILPIFGIQKLLWLRSNKPDIFGRIHRWLNAADYINFKLCNVEATDESLASRLMLLDLRTRTWSGELLAACDLPVSLLADVVTSGSFLGNVTVKAQDLLGIPKGTPVIAGGHDHPCGAFALGINDPGDILDSMGTSESVFTVLEEPCLSGDLARTGYQQGVHVTPGRYYANGGLFTCGAAVEWFRETISVESNSYDELVNSARKAPAGSRGVTFLPHLRLSSPPNNDDRAKGAFVGLSIATQPQDLARALLEGLALDAYHSLQGLRKHFSLSPQRICTIGGGARNSLLMTVKATLARQDLLVPQVDEVTTLGATMLAGLGSGTFSTFQEAQNLMSATYVRVKPTKELEGFYQTLYQQVFCHLYDALAPLHHSLHDLTANADLQEHTG